MTNQTENDPKERVATTAKFDHEEEDFISFRMAFTAGAIIILGFLAVLALVVNVSDEARTNAIEDHRNNISGNDSLETEIDSGKARPFPSSNTNLAPLRFAIAPVISPEKSYINYKRLVDYVGAALDRAGKIITRSSYAEINELLRNGDCDVALICTYSYVKARNEFGARLLAVPVVHGALSYQSFFIVHADSEFRIIEDLKGKRLGFADEISTSGWLYLAVLLKKRGLDPMTYFSRRTRTGSHDSSIFAVLDKYVDFAAVDSLVFEQMPPKTKRRLRVIHRSPRFGMPPLVTPVSLDDTTRDQILAVLLSMHQEPVGLEILRDLHMDSFQIIDDAKYQSVEDLVRQWETE